MASPPEVWANGAGRAVWVFSIRLMGADYNITERGGPVTVFWRHPRPFRPANAARALTRLLVVAGTLDVISPPGFAGATSPEVAAADVDAASSDGGNT
jgi:hypothetical protein